MTERSLCPERRRIVEIVEQLGFGRIEQLWIRNGEPCFNPAPRIVEEIRLTSDSERRPDTNNPDLTLKQEFEHLFRHLARLLDGVVTIEVRHSVPFRLIAERRYVSSVPAAPCGDGHELCEE